MIIIQLNYKIFSILFILIFISSHQTLLAEKAYFDISDQEIQIQTNFNGKEVIIFGLTNPNLDTVLIIKGPKRDAKLSMKERFFGFWIKAKKIIYKDMPSIFFIASSSPIEKILNNDTITKKQLTFETIFTNMITKRNFINQSNLSFWRDNLIRIQKNKKLYNVFNLKIVDEKLFQSRIFFPSNTLPGNYSVNIFQIKDNKIVSERKKSIIIKKTGIGNTIYKFAHDQPMTYGILSILFAIIAGLAAATAFRRL